MADPVDPNEDHARRLAARRILRAERRPVAGAASQQPAPAPQGPPAWAWGAAAAAVVVAGAVIVAWLGWPFWMASAH